MGWRGPGALWGQSEKSTDPIHRGFPPDLTPTSQRPSLQIPSHWGLGFNIGAWSGDVSIQSVATLQDLLIKVWRSSLCILDALFYFFEISKLSDFTGPLRADTVAPCLRGPVMQETSLLLAWPGLTSWGVGLTCGSHGVRCQTCKALFLSQKRIQR